MNPNTELINAPAIEAPKLSSYAAMVRGLATAAQNCVQVRVKVLKKIVEIGINTTIPRYASVKPSVRPNPGSTLFRFVAIRAILTSRLIDLVEHAAVAEELRLRLFPSTEIRIDREQRQVRELARVPGRDDPVARAEEILRDYFLPCWAVEKFQVGFRDGRGAVATTDLVDPCDRRFGQNADRRIDYLELVGAELLERQSRVVLPCDQHVADFALDEGRGRAARAGIKHRHVLVERADERGGLGLVTAVLLQRVAPCRQKIPSRTARGFRIRRDYRDARLHEVVPIVNLLRIPFAHQQHDGRSVGATVVRQPRLPISG